MFEKIEVAGNNKAPLYAWLSNKDLNGWNDQEPSWNFCKYLINKEGKLTHFFESKITPENSEFLKAVGI
jgi:glutathione peroxidase